MPSRFEVVSDHDEAVWNGCSVHAVFCDSMSSLFLQKVAVDGHFGHGVADDENVSWPKAIILLQAIVEDLEAENIDNSEDQQSGYAFFDERCFREGGHVFSELQVDEGVGRDGEQGDKTSDNSVAWNADCVWTAFTSETSISREIDTEQNENGDNIQCECDLGNAECRSAWMSHNADDDLDCAFECRCPEENPCGVDDGECDDTTQEVDNS